MPAKQHETGIGTPHDECPGCHANLATEHNGRWGSDRIGVEIRGVYDGTLYWSCPRCYVRWHRFPEGHPLHERAKKYVELKQ